MTNVHSVYTSISSLSRLLRSHVKCFYPGVKISSSFKLMDALACTVGRKGHSDLKYRPIKQNLISFLMAPKTIAIVQDYLPEPDEAELLLSVTRWSIKHNAKANDEQAMIRILRVLFGFKMQAKTAIHMFENSNAEIHLGKAHKLIGDNKYIHRKIIQLSREKDRPVADLTYEDMIATCMSSMFDFSHLNKLPHYFVANKLYGNREAYFITQYWGDIEKCGGCTSEESEVRIMHTKNRPACSRLMSSDERRLFLSEIKRPDLALLDADWYIDDVI